MPINVKVTVVISRKLKEATQRSPQIVLQHLNRAMSASALWTETKIKEFITEIGLVDTGLLRSRVHGRVVSANIRQVKGEVATNNVKYARIHEYGGTILPKNGRALAIPFNKASALIQATAGSLRNVPGLYVVSGQGRANAFLYQSGNPRVGWTLVKSVYIREKRFMRTGLQRAMPRIKELFHKATQRALRAVFGGEE
jgi:hypothetical protein